jgi:hypothetical protein
LIQTTQDDAICKSMGVEVSYKKESERVVISVPLLSEKVVLTVIDCLVCEMDIYKKSCLI